MDKETTSALRNEIETLLRLLPVRGLIGIRIYRIVGMLLDRIENLEDAIAELYRDRV